MEGQRPDHTLQPRRGQRAYLRLADQPIQTGRAAPISSLSPLGHAPILVSYGQEQPAQKRGGGEPG